MPTTAGLGGAPEVNDGAWSTTIVKGPAVVEPTVLVAETANVNVPAAVGVPVSVPSP